MRVLTFPRPRYKFIPGFPPADAGTLFTNLAKIESWINGIVSHKNVQASAELETNAGPHG